MKKLLTVFALLAIVLCHEPMSGIERMQVHDIFKQLLDSEMGRDLFTSIQLELESGTNQNMVDKIVQMLEKLRDEINDNKNEGLKLLGTRRATCDSKDSDLHDEINELKDKIARADMAFPTLQEQIDNKKSQIDSKNQEVTDAQKAIVDLDEKNQEALAHYADTVTEHNNMIEALNQAKRLITQLVAGKGNAFL